MYKLFGYVLGVTNGTNGVLRCILAYDLLYYICYSHDIDYLGKVFSLY